MKKIAFVFDGLGEGGIERVGCDFIKLSKKLGYEIDVYNLNPKNITFEKNIPSNIKIFHRKFPKEFCSEVYSYGVQKWWWGKYAYVLISPCVTLFQILYKLFSKRRKYDIAIAMAGHINDLSFVSKNFIKAQKKITWCHGAIISYFAMCDAYPMLYKNIDKMVVLTTADQKDIYAGHKFMYRKTIQQMYNPTFFNRSKVNTEIAAQIKEKYGEFVLMVGRIDRGKSQDIAVKVIKELKNRGIDKKIVFVGTGVEFENVRKLAVEEGVAENCIFEGFKTNVPDYIEASYINILTSKWEGLPTVIIEAMTLGKPCVMTNCDDGEVSQHGKYCILTQIDSVNELADGLYELYSNKETYNKYVNLSLERARAFTPEIILEQLKTLFETN